jgi:hypothetical protein
MDKHFKCRSTAESMGNETNNAGTACGAGGK